MPAGVNLDLALKGIVSKSRDIDVDQAKNQLFSDSEIYANSKYFQYLSDYSNGIIQFSPPKAIKGEFSDDKFLKLTEALFPAESKIATESSVRSTIVNDHLISRVSDKVHIDYQLSEKDYSGLHFSYIMDVLGRNCLLYTSDAADE